MATTLQLVEAIMQRHSVRTFSRKLPTESQMTAIRQSFLSTGLIGEWSDCRICVKITDGEEVITGYRLEKIALEAVAVGLATCWKSISGGVALEFGIQAMRPSISERILRFILKLKPRVNGNTTHGNLSLVAQLVDRAPSAYNRRPWRLASTDDFIVLSYTGRSRLDKVSFGIAAFHLNIALSYLSQNRPNA